MGTCKIVEWCDNPKCVIGCLAKHAVEAEREACAKVCRDKKTFNHDWDSYAAKLLERVAEDIEKRSNDQAQAHAAGMSPAAQC